MVLMDVSPFLPLCEGLVVERVEDTATTLTIAVASTSLVACCPLCQEPSEHFHGHYQRVVADLPCSGRQVTLRLKVRKFVCLNLACPRVIFAERLASLVQPRARHTIRLLSALRSLGFATSGEAGSRLAPQVGMQASPSTLLRRMKDTPLPLPTHTVTKVGLDDFALRRGLTYHASHNLAKTVIEFSVCILRAHLRERCGAAYKRAALHHDAGREPSASQEGPSPP
jgi:hypothetical protein